MRTVFGIEDAERLTSCASGSAAMLDIGSNRCAGGDRAAAAAADDRPGMWRRFLRLRAEADDVIYDEIRRRRAGPGPPTATTCSRSCCRRATRTASR